MGTRQYKTQQPGNPEIRSEAGADAAPVTLAGLGDDDAVMQIAGRDVTINEIVEGAFEASGMSLDEWNAADPVVRDGLMANRRKELEVIFTSSTASNAELDAARAAAQANVARRQAARANAPKVATLDPRAHLPHKDEIDPFEITAPVETQQGWIAPSKQIAVPQRFK